MTGTWSSQPVQLRRRRCARRDRRRARAARLLVDAGRHAGQRRRAGVVHDTRAPRCAAARGAPRVENSIEAARRADRRTAARARRASRRARAARSTGRPSSVSSDVARSRELRRIRARPDVDAVAEHHQLGASAAAFRQNPGELPPRDVQIVRPLDSARSPVAASIASAERDAGRQRQQRASRDRGSTRARSRRSAPPRHTDRPPAAKTTCGPGVRGRRSARRRRRRRLRVAGARQASPRRRWSIRSRRNRRTARPRRPSAARRDAIASAKSCGSGRADSGSASSDGLDFKADVDGRRRMRQRADRHEVGAGRPRAPESARA